MLPSSQVTGPSCEFANLQWPYTLDVHRLLLDLRGQGGLTLGQVLEIGVQALTGLIHLHHLSATHGDLRAANVLVDALDPLRIMLADFGLSHVLTRSTASTGETRVACRAYVSENCCEKPHKSRETSRAPCVFPSPRSHVHTFLQTPLEPPTSA